MFKETGDVDAAIQYYLSILESEDAKGKAKLKKIFLKSCLKHYYAVKEKISKRSRDWDLQDLMPVKKTSYLCEDLLSILRLCLESSEKMLELGDQMNATTKAEDLGAVLGKILGVVEYGVTSKILGGVVIQDSLSSMLAEFRKIAQILEQMNQKADPVFIERRVNLIARRNRGKLSDQQKLFIASVAAIFKP